MQEIEFQLPHLRLAGLRQGNANKPVILALHGWLDNAASFVPLSEHLPLADYQLFAVDMAGHGKSQHRSADAHYHLVDWVQDLHQLVLSQQWSQVVLLGHSLGGIVASLYASVFPEYVSKLILIEAMGPYSKTAETAPKQIRESIDSRIAIEQKQAKHPASLKNATVARKMAGDMSKENAELLVTRNLQYENEQWRWRTDRRLRTLSSTRFTEPQATAVLSGIECPVLVLLGQSGFDKLKLLAEQRQGLLSSLELVTCSGGHHCHMDFPDEIAKQITLFL